MQKIRVGGGVETTGLPGIGGGGRVELGNGGGTSVEVGGARLCVNNMSCYFIYFLYVFNL